MRHTCDGIETTILATPIIYSNRTTRILRCRVRGLWRVLSCGFVDASTHLPCVFSTEHTGRVIPPQSCWQAIDGRPKWRPLQWLREYFRYTRRGTTRGRQELRVLPLGFARSGRAVGSPRRYGGHECTWRCRHKFGAEPRSCSTTVQIRPTRPKRKAPILRF